MIATALCAALVGQAQAEEMRLLRFPDIHGDTVVFTYASDLWSADRRGGLARRLTSHAGVEGRARISPDGKWIAFTGEYDGNPDVFVIPIEGGEPKRLTYESDSDIVLDWTPDGKVMYASSYGNFINRQQRLWLVDPKGGPSERTVIDEISAGSVMADGKTFVYNRYGVQPNWRRYRGGRQGRVSMFNVATNSYSELPSRRENSWWPMAIGDQIWYVSDRQAGTLNLFRYDTKTRRDTQMTRFTDTDIRFPGTDGKTIVFERDGFIWAYDVADGKTEKLSPRVLSDFVVARPSLRRLGDQITALSISPSGNRVMVEARGEIFSVPARAGETRNLTQTPGSRERWPSWSPDGQTIAYVSDKTGNYEVYIESQRGGEPTQLTTNSGLPISGIAWSPDSKMIAITTESQQLWILDVATKKLTRVATGRFAPVAFDISPDSKWIAYVDQKPNGFGFISLYEIATGKTTEVTDGSYDDGAVEFDLGGKYLYFTSIRTFNPSFGAFEFSLKVDDGTRFYAIPLTRDLTNPLIAPADEEPEAPAQRPAAPAGAPPAAPSGAPSLKIDLEGMADRAIVLPIPAGNHFLVTAVNNGFIYFSGGSLAQFSLTSRESTPLTQGVPPGLISFNPSRTKMAYQGGGGVHIVDVRPGIQPGQGRVDVSGVEAIIDPKLEWRQIYWEAWRYVRDNFYDPEMLGLNWKAVGDQYAAQLPYVRHRSDLNYVFTLMISELGTGHAYVQGGDMGPMPTPVPVGMLGVDYAIEGEFVKLAKIYRGSQYEESRRGPLGEPGLNVNDGDYLLEIDGKPVNKNVNPSSLLVNRGPNRTVVLTVNSRPTLEGARRIRVRPTFSEGQIRYADFVEANRKRVAELSGGRIGYMHVPDTATEGAQEFVRGFYSQTDREALIVDERWNGGGFIQPWFVDTLTRRIRAGIQQRNAQEATDAVAIEGPMVMLINGYAGSGGDFFPWMFRQSRRGPLIGTRTWGGLVGISGWAPLVDGGGVTAPEFGIFDRETGKWIAENEGVEPDIEVDNRPDLRAQGRDPQLERAVEHLLGELKKGRPEIRRPAFPRVRP